MADTTEELGRRLGTMRDLGSVVGTMKALAAVSIRQYERAAQALEVYNRAVELGLMAALRAQPGLLAGSRPHRGEGPVAAFVLGSDQGMCGPLNGRVADLALESLRILQPDASQRTILAVGERMRARLEDAGEEVREFHNVPGSVSGITSVVQDLLLRLDQWREEGKAQRVRIFHARQSGGATFQTLERHLLPLDRQRLGELARESWPTNQLPLSMGPWEETFSALVQQYLLVSLFRALADSLASENASRLAAMQGAERNIEERIGQLTQDYNQARQNAITEELLDIAAGFEVLRD